LASFLVNGHPLYPKSVAIIGDLLAGKTGIVLSDLVVSESLWALSHLAYCDAFGHTSYDVEFKNATFRKHHAVIFEGAHSGKVAAVVDFVKGLQDLGQLRVSHPNNAEWIRQINRTHERIRSDRMLPGDATHLAIAEQHARTLVTADEAFAKTGGISPAKLNMVWVRPGTPSPPAPVAARSAGPAAKKVSRKAKRRRGH